MGRRPNTEQRRGEIVDALHLELAECGYERASIKSIAERAGLASGLVHYHFRNKEEILLVLLDRLIAEADQRYEQASAACVFPGDRLRAYASARLGFGDHAQAQQVQAWVSIIAEVIGQPAVRERVSTWMNGDHAMLSKLFKKAGAESPRAHASMLLAIILGAFSLHSIDVKRVRPRYALEQTLDWLEQLLG